MVNDPEYSSLVDKHGSMKTDGEMSLITEEQHRCQKKWARQTVLEMECRNKNESYNLGGLINSVIMRLMLTEMDVAEVYSPPRVAAMAKRMGLQAGWSLDLTTRDEQGRASDFNKVEMRNHAIRKILKDKPKLFIGSPICTPFSQMNNINYSKLKPEEVQQRMEYGRKHLEFCMRPYEIQWSEGRYSFHEHPQAASSWEQACVKKMLKKAGVTRVVGDQCMYGLKANEGDRWGPARKSTGFMTNSACVAQALQQRCPNTRNDQVHKHVVLQSGRTTVAQVYPPELCKAICLEFKEQFEVDRKGQFLLAELESSDVGKGGAMVKIANKLKETYKTVIEDDEAQLEVAWDDVSGVARNPIAANVARQEDIDYVKKTNLYTNVPIQECIRKTGKPPISTRWIDINKGDEARPNYRSRLVAKEVDTHKREDLLASTPRLEALKIILCMTACCNKGEIVMINDVSRAFFLAKAKREVFVKLPQEDIGPGEEGLCGRLNFSMYGTRDAAQNWFEEYSQGLVRVGFKQGLATPCVFYHESRAIRTYVHGDDYVSTGTKEDLLWLKTELEKKYQVKTQFLGPEEDQLQEVKILNRVVGWNGNEGISYEAACGHNYRPTQT